MITPDILPALPELSLSVLLPMRNEGKIARSKINSVIEEIKNSEKTRLVVVNSSSDDNTKDIAVNALKKSILPKSRWDVLDSEIPGKTRAVNLGLSIIETDLVMMMDADAISSPGWLRLCQEIFSNQKIGLVCGMEQYGSNRIRISSESVYKKLSNNRRLSQSLNSSILVVEGSMCCFRKDALGGMSLNENFNADDSQLAILCSRNNFLSIMDRRLTFHEANELSRTGNLRRRVRRGRGLSRNLVANIGMALPRNNPVNPDVFLRTIGLYLLLPWVSTFVLTCILSFIIFPESAPLLTSDANIRFGLISLLLSIIIWPTGRSLMEGSAIMVIAQISTLTHSSKDAWNPDRQRE